MSVQDELDRLEALGRDLGVSSTQREKARDAWETINDDLILAAWARIEARSAEFEALVARLTTVVDDIAANRLTTAIDDVTAILSDVESAANPDGGGGGTG